MSTPLSTPNIPRDFSAIGNWFETTFNSFKAEIKVWLLQALISGVLQVGLWIIATALVFTFLLPDVLPTIMSGENPFVSEEVFARNHPELQQLLLDNLATVISLAVLFIIISWALQTYLWAGMTFTALKQQSGEPITVGDLFGAGFAVPNAMGAGFIAGLILLLPFICCFLPVLFVLPFFLFMMPIIIDRRPGAFASLSQSYEIVKQNFWLFFVYVLAIIGIYVGLQFVSNILQMIYQPLWLLYVIALMLISPIYTMFPVVAYASMFKDQPPVSPWGSGPPQYMPPAYTPPPDNEQPEAGPESPPLDSTDQS